MGGRVRCTGEAIYFKYYNRLGVIAKLATSYKVTGEDRAITAKMVETTKEWVIPTGSGYFFSPSISVLEKFARGDVS
jgi:hypothetical protein